MQTISRDQAVYTMSKDNPPALTVKPGTTVLFETSDCFANQIQSETDYSGLDWNKVNPATGPLYVEGAEVGDVLSVKIEKIQVADQGLVFAEKGLGVLGHRLEGTYVKFFPIVDDHAVITDTLKIPVNKHIGVMGVAPKEGSIGTAAPDDHGGNLDCKELAEGATLYFEVNTPGALLAIGDLHAVMADGECGASGLEITGEVRVTVDVIKGKKMPTPMIITDTHIMTIVSHEDLDIAVDKSAENLADYIMDTYGLNLKEAAMLLALAAHTKICQVVDPKKTARTEIRKDYIGSGFFQG